MAYMNQEKKAKIAAALKQVMPTGWKYSLAVRHHSTIVCTITKAPFDLLGAQVQNEHNAGATYAQLNPYHYRSQCTDECLGEVYEAIMDCLNIDNFDNSDTQTDYFHVGHYVALNIGAWNKPFEFTQPTAIAA